MASATTIRDLQVGSYIQWQLKSGALPSYKLDIQVMYRTWDTAGVLFTVSTEDNSKSVTLEVGVCFWVCLKKNV